MITKEVRSYEVSLWTLQDSFITVLKWSDVEHSGRIQNPEMELNVDGTQNFTFNIPMYLYYEVPDSNNEHITRLEKRENPIWYNTQNGNLIVGLRKIKVIFNKGTDDEQVFEFLITKVNEKHEQDQLTCEVTCEGLAFHELGKIGYKLALSQDTFLLDKESWDENGEWTKYDGTIADTEPVESVQYWCEHCGLVLAPNDPAEMEQNTWYYEIKMNWGSFNTSRDTHKVYENEYVSSWTDELVPQTIESEREKYRPIDVSESNIYNITQTIAETFEIYCRYEYGYDDNYHIISRKVVFYNNYLNEDNFISFTYPYTSKQISRELDATELTTKMYVRSQENDVVASGVISIADCPVNKTKEDYLLNFDYLYSIGTITQEQYDAVHTFEKEVRQLNTDLENLNLELNALENIIIEKEALVKVYEESIILDAEQVDYNAALLDQLGGDKGYLTRGIANPYSTYIKKDKDNNYYIDLKNDDKGIDIDASHFIIFRVYNSVNKVFKNRINDYTVVLDSYGFVSQVKLNNLTESFTTDVHYSTVDTTGNDWTVSTIIGANDASETSSSLLIYLVYKYNPHLYYEEINNTWLAKQDQDQAAYNEADADLAAAKAAKTTKNAAYESKLADKRQLIQKFERMMGPALREGYWQPEDYKDYGDNKTVNDLGLTSTYSSSTLISDTGKGAVIGWDATLFDDEDKLYYEESVLRTQVYYPCIALNSTMTSYISTWLSNNKIPMLIFNNNYYKELTQTEAAEIQNMTRFSLGGDMHLGFINKENTTTVIPVLVITGAQSMTNDEIKFLITHSNAKLGTTEIDTENATITISSDAISLSASDFYWDTSIVPSATSIADYRVVYPRIKISSNDLNTSSIVLRYNNTLLNVFEDYATLSRLTTRDNKAYLEYFITIKPHVFFNIGTYTGTFVMKYTLSNAATCIYLDATGVMEDSSKPKVSYTIDVNVLNEDYISTLYKQLTQLVMINDTELKFENIFGYISKINLKLDTPWEDQIEVKNYKTKFEDLFSTIVASSEEMRKNGAVLDMACSGDIAMNSRALEQTIDVHYDMLQQFLDSGFDSSEVVKDKLSELFTEASLILTSANKSLDEVRNLNLKNFNILSGFIQNVAAGLTPNIISSQTRPVVYNTGDIWNELDSSGHIIGTYVATASSTSTSNGFTRTFDGALASIRGAALNIDTVEGTVEILAQNKIDIKTGGYLYLAGENVDIVGNNTVNIGGTTINIASLNRNGTTYNPGGINLISSSTTSGSRILMTPTKITMGGASIEMYTGSTGTASAIKIDGTDGIWIGSGRKIELYTGTTSTGTSVQITPSRFFAGVASGTAAAAAEISAGTIIMATGTASSFSTSDITINSSGSLTGLKLTKDSFGLAVGSSTTRAVFLANSNGITIGTGETPITSGSYVSISGSGISIGSLADVYLNTNNIKLQTNVSASTGLGTTIFAIGSNLQSITNSTNVNTLNNDSTVDFLINSSGVFLKGYVYAAGGSFTGAVHASSFELTGGTMPVSYINSTELQNAISTNSTVTNAASTASSAATAATNITNAMAPITSYGLLGYNSSNAGQTVNGTIYDSNGYPIYNSTSYGLILGNSQTKPMLIGSSGGIHIVNSQGTGTAIVIDNTGIEIASGGNFEVNTTNLLIDSNPSSGNAYFRLGASATPVLQYTSSGLSVKGAITATSFTLESGVTIPYSSISGAPSSFSVNGVGWTEWPSSSGNYYVSLTSTADNENVKGILIGVSEASNVTQHLIVPYAVGSNKTVVDISKNGINFDTYDSQNNDALANYIHINASGIEVQGEHISINGADCWSRGDILYGPTKPISPTDSNGQPLATWIWIKPIESTQWVYNLQSSQLNTITTSTSINDLQTVNGDTEQVPNGNTKYSYTITCTLRSYNNVINYDAIFGIIIANKATGEQDRKSLGYDVTSDKRIVPVKVNSGTLTNSSDTTITFTYTKRGDSIDAYNVCDGPTTYCSIGLLNAMDSTAPSTYNERFEVRDIRIEVSANTSNGTTGTFPCQVYYVKEATT